MRKQDAALAAAIADEVRRYLHDHPDASDTLIGVSKFWLNRDPSGTTVAAVQAALDTLLAEGAIERHELPGGVHIYCRAAKHPASS